MVNNGVYDVHDAVSNYAAKKAKYILSKITGKNGESFEIDEQNIRVLKRGLVSSVASLVLKYQDMTINKPGEKRILIKYFGKKGDEKRKRIRFKNFAESTKNTCNFLSGNKDFPAFYFFESDEDLGGEFGGDFLGLEQIGDKTLHEILNGYNHDNMLHLIQGVLPPMIRFQINSTKNLERFIKNGKMEKEVYESIFKKRDSIKRLLDYSRAIKGLDSINELSESLKKEIIKLSVPIRRIYEPRKDTFRVTHGDPIFKNIVLIDEENQKYGFIDADPILGDGLLDLGALLATPNINLSPSDWDYLTKIFLLTNEKELEESKIDLHSTRSKLVSKLEDFGVKFSDEEIPGNHNFYVIGTIFSRCARISAKVNDLKRYYPKVYERIERDDPGIATTIDDMKKNMSLSLWEMISAPNKFEISRDEYIDNLTELYQLLGNEGIIKAAEEYIGDNKNGQNDLRNKKNKNRISPTRRRNFTKKSYAPASKERLEKTKKEIV